MVVGDRVGLLGIPWDVVGAIESALATNLDRPSTFGVTPPLFEVKIDTPLPDPTSATAGDSSAEVRLSNPKRLRRTPPRKDGEGHLQNRGPYISVTPILKRDIWTYGTLGTSI